MGGGARVKSGLSGTSVCPAHKQMIICKYLRCPQIHGRGPTSPFFFMGRYVRTNGNIIVCTSCHLQVAPWPPYNNSSRVLSDSHNQSEITALPLSSVWIV